jgi:hypothetical protein
MDRSPDPPRIRLLAQRDPACAGLVRRLTDLAGAALRRSYLDEEFAFTLRLGTAGPGGPAAGQRTLIWPEGVSVRYSIIAALGLRYLPEPDRREVLGGDDCDDLLGRLAKGLDDLTRPGDVALFCWAAAEAGHSELPHGIDQLAKLDRPARRGRSGGPGASLDVVSAAWVVTALVAARTVSDVEEHLAAARDRLLKARLTLFPHVTGGAAPWYRAHVGSFADQIYPVQALARLHASGDDPEALAVAGRVAGMLCQAQAATGQWWWHYDARSGQVIEGYPVYSVHQHAMAPMALFDLADAGGELELDAVRSGLRWLAAPGETSERLIAEDVPVIWRKVARDDPRKLVRGVAAMTTAIWPGASPPGRGRLFPPRSVDHECRPYELGWLLYAWLGGAGS